jgi:hypothetical protein
MQLRRALVIAALCVVAGAAPAWSAPKPPAAPVTSIAITPLSTLGSEDTSAAAKKLEAELARELSAASGAKITGSADVIEAIRKAKKPILRACDGDASCLADVGKLVSTSHVVFGEVGGLGDVQVVYLILVDTTSGKEVRRTQVSLAAAAAEQGGMKGGAIRLLDPEKFAGRLAITTPVKDAVIYVDGRRVGKTPTPAFPLAVGPHALRVTHPEHRDYVRFVDVAFDRDTAVPVELVPYDAIDTELGTTGPGTPKSNVTYVDVPPPWYRRPWAIGAFAALALTGAVIVGVATADGVPFDASGTVKPPE